MAMPKLGTAPKGQTSMKGTMHFPAKSSTKKNSACAMYKSEPLNGPSVHGGEKGTGDSNNN